MQSRLGADELIEWIVFYEHEPWGYEVDERRHTQRIATQVNCTPRGRGAKPVNWIDLYRDPWGSAMLEERGFTPEQRAFLDQRKKRRKVRRE